MGSTATKTNEDKFSIVTRTGEVIRLDKQTVIKYITNNTDISDYEFNMFFQLCKVNKVNPFLKEAYLIKYGSMPATIVLDYKVLQQIAEENPSFNGMRHGIIVQTAKGDVIKRSSEDGAFLLKGETLVAGYCAVYRKDRDNPTFVTASFEEFKGVKKDGTANSNWETKPCFMIVKVAKAQALREAFPNMVGSNVYTPEEMDSVKAPSTQAEGKTNVTNTLVDDDACEVDVDVTTNAEEEDTNGKN